MLFFFCCDLIISFYYLGFDLFIPDIFVRNVVILFSVYSAEKNVNTALAYFLNTGCNYCVLRSVQAN